MKRIPGFGRGMVALALVGAIAAFTLVACGDDDDDDAGVTPGADDNHVEDVYTFGDIEIHGAYTRETVNEVAAVYMKIKNNGLEDTLVSAEADIGSNWQIHEAVTDGASTRMQEVEGGLVIPASGEVALEPGGYHVMILGVDDPPEAGDHIHVDLTFAKAGLITLSVPVQALDGSNGMDHGDDERGDDNNDDDDEEAES